MYPTISPAAAMSLAVMRQQETLAAAERRHLAEQVLAYRHLAQGREARRRTRTARLPLLRLRLMAPHPLR